MQHNVHHFLAFDLGATSGRTILAKLEDGRVSLKELTRFPNQITRHGSRYYWNIYSLYESLKDGLRAAMAENVEICSIGIDTWGVDFACIAEDGAVAGLPRAYRDPYTNGVPEEFFKRVPKEKVYESTGIQTMNFNTLYQICAAKAECSSAIGAAHKLLFMPDALSFLLTGKMVCEYTIASTSQMLNARSRQFDPMLLRAAGINAALLPPVVMPCAVIGALSADIQQECRTPPIPLIAVAGHDTASAIAAVPAENEGFAYLSSGTWSLMGIEVGEPIINHQSFEMDFTNEGGADGRICFLKNITGMWLLEQCRKEWEREGKHYGYDEIVAMAQSVQSCRYCINPDHPSFANPASMTRAIASYCAENGQDAPQTHAEYVRCIFESLALKYGDTLKDLQTIAPFKIEKLHVIGGGSQNHLLNQMTANRTGIPVAAGPAEATAIGNVLMQAKGLGIVKSLNEIRSIVRASAMPQIFYPR